MAFVVALSCVTVHGETSNTRSPAAPVTIYTQFDNEHSPAAIEIMKVELAAVMEPVGLDFEWRSIEASRQNRTAVELVVVTFRGTCRMEEILPLRKNPGALGWTHTSDGVVLPFSDIDCDAIRSLIGRRAATAGLHEREALFGRALGRVLAHELYHVFAKTKGHGTRGIAKPFYNSVELTSEHFQFERKESQTLRTTALPALIHAALPMPSAAGLAPR